MTEAYPLQWPAGVPRTERKMTSRFKATLHRALENVREELRRFGENSGKKVTNLVLSSNYTLAESHPRDTGVAAYFTWDGLAVCIAVDRYPKIEDNLQAIAHVIEAERAKMRHGGLNIVRAAFRGYAALPPPEPGRLWWKVLGVQKSCSLATAQTAYHDLAVEHHPDNPNGGDVAKMVEINRAWEEAQAALS